MAWTWAAASARGTSHMRTKTRCQDAQACRSYGTLGTIFFSVVADGAGSAELGGEGAHLACRSLERSAREHFVKTVELPNEAIMMEWVDLARDRLAFAATKRGVERRQLASTLLLVMATEGELVTGHVGDGGIVFCRECSDAWEVASWPAHGEYVNTTQFLTDDPAAALRFNRIEGPIASVAAFTDGIERLVLSFKSRQAHGPFFKHMLAPVEGSVTKGRDKRLSELVGQFLDSSQVNDRTDDDKTLVLAARK
jgi:hypothetical protein